MFQGPGFTGTQRRNKETSSKSCDNADRYWVSQYKIVQTTSAVQCETCAEDKCITSPALQLWKITIIHTHTFVQLFLQRHSSLTIIYLSCTHLS